MSLMRLLASNKRNTKRWGITNLWKIQSGETRVSLMHKNHINFQVHSEIISLWNFNFGGTVISSLGTLTYTHGSECRVHWNTEMSQAKLTTYCNGLKL